MFICEVDVDLDTGGVVVKRIVQGTDIGQIIDIKALRMQLQGGIGSASMDTATYEECIYDTEGTGRMLTNNMLEYKWRPFNQFPEHDCTIMESQIDSFMFKAVGIGEISGAAAASAVLMAVSNAIGTPVNEYPATPDVILKALQKA
jgi:CO/xanthine dehydrogenase Mo-binding subunit